MSKGILSIILTCLLPSVLSAKVICDGDCQVFNGSIGLKQQAIKGAGGDKKNQSSQVTGTVTGSEKDNIDTMSPHKLDGNSHSKSSFTKRNVKNDLTQNHSEQLRGISSEKEDADSNLPLYFSKLTANSVENKFVVLAKGEARKRLAGLSSGSLLKIIIKQDIVASARVPTPVVGTVVGGSYAGSKIYGEALLDDELKRVLFNFKTITGGIITEEYIVKAAGLDVLGRVGLQGKYHADDIGFGIASFFATATAIAADSQVERSKNNNGDWVENPSAENATKKGVAGAVGRVAERLSNRAMNAPGRTEIQGPLLVQVILDESPYLKK